MAEWRGSSHTCDERHRFARFRERHRLATFDIIGDLLPETLGLSIGKSGRQFKLFCRQRHDGGHVLGATHQDNLITASRC